MREGCSAEELLAVEVINTAFRDAYNENYDNYNIIMLRRFILTTKWIDYTNLSRDYLIEQMTKDHNELKSKKFRIK